MNSRRRTLFILLLSMLVPGCFGGGAAPGRGNYLDDKVTSARAVAALQRSGDDFGNVSVRTHHSVVHLDGAVASVQLKREAERVVRSLSRVRDVRNELEVRVKSSLPATGRMGSDHPQ